MDQPTSSFTINVKAKFSLITVRLFKSNFVFQERPTIVGTTCFHDQNDNEQKENGALIVIYTSELPEANYYLSADQLCLITIRNIEKTINTVFKNKVK